MEQTLGGGGSVPLRASKMDIHEDITDELSGDGMIIIDGRNVAIVPYSLAPAVSPLVAEGSISGPEPLLKRVKRSREVKLALENGPVVALRCEGGRNGTRWVKAMRA
jgi:hypothetical protein